METESINNEFKYKTKFQWYIKTNSLWLGIIEIIGKDGIEIYRVIVEIVKVKKIKFHHYRFERFIFSQRSWTIEIMGSKYPLTVFLEIREAYKNYYELTSPNVVVFTTRDTKRNKLYKYYCKLFFDYGFKTMEYTNSFQTAFLCFKHEHLFHKKEKGTLKKYFSELCDNGLFL